MTDRKKSWRPRFSLRTLLFVTALVAVIAAWFANSAMRQRRAVAALKKLGAEVVYEDHSSRSSAWYPEWLRRWLGVDFFARATEVQFGSTPDYVVTTGSGTATPNTVILSQSSRPSKTLTGGPIVLRPRGPPRPAMIIGEEAMQQLRRLPYLRKLTLTGFTTNQAKSPRGISFIGQFGNGLELDAQSLQLLRDHPTLEELDLTSMLVDDEVLAALDGFQHLKRLCLSKPRFSAEGAKHLATLSSLQQLNFDSVTGNYPGRPPPSAHAPWPDEDGIRYFASLTQLRELNLIDARITDVGAAHLANLTNLRKLVLTNNRITDDGLRDFSKLTKLEALYLPNLPITDVGLEHLRGATAMQLLMLSGTKITDAGLIHLSGMTEIESLDISFTAITDESVDQLLHFKKLKNLRLLGTGISRQGSARVQQAFPTAKILMPFGAAPAP